VVLSCWARTDHRTCASWRPTRCAGHAADDGVLGVHALEKKKDRFAEAVDGMPARDSTHVGEPVGQGQGQLGDGFAPASAM